MKSICLSVSFIILCSFSSFLNEPIDRIGVSGPISYNEKNYHLAWSSQTKEAYFIQEYLPEGQTLENFNEMLTINVFVTDLSLEQAVKIKTNELIERKKTDETCNFMVQKNANSKEIVVDFVMSDINNNRKGVAEFNAYHYKQVDLGSDRKAIVLYYYTKRAYNKEVKSFFMNLRAIRNEALSTFMKAEIPIIKLKD